MNSVKLVIFDTQYHLGAINTPLPVDSAGKHYPDGMYEDFYNHYKPKVLAASKEIDKKKKVYFN